MNEYWVIALSIGLLSVAALFTSSTEVQLIRENRRLEAQIDTCVSYTDNFLEELSRCNEENLKLKLNLSGKILNADSSGSESLPLILVGETYQQKKQRLFLQD